MHKALTIIVLACVLCCSAIKTQAQETVSLSVRWVYPYNNSSYRLYTGHLATFVYIGEYGNDETEYDGSELQAFEVQLVGDVDYGDVVINRVHPTCWRVEMMSDYLLLKKTWRANPEFDGLCFEYYFPVMLHGTL